MSEQLKDEIVEKAKELANVILAYEPGYEEAVELLAQIDKLEQIVENRVAGSRR